MAGTRITIESNAEEVLQAFADLQRSAGDLAPLFRDIGEYLFLSHRFRWDLMIAPDGTPWEGLDPAYRERKKRHKDDILVLDRFLRDQLAYQAAPDGLDFGTNRIYAATHQFGDPDRGITARPFLGLSDDDRNEIIDLAREHLEDAIRSTPSNHP